jgi:hypothetical protein
MAIPVFLILRDDPAFVGLQWLAAQTAHFDAKRHEVDAGPCESGTIGRPPQTSL